MATKIEPLIMTIVDAATGESIDREMTADESANYKELQKQSKAAEIQTQAKAAARESALAKLADLGLTAEEIAAL
jgi:DNA-binding NarL/FixJ family response regulator